MCFTTLNRFLDPSWHLFANYLYQLFALFLSFVFSSCNSFYQPQHLHTFTLFLYLRNQSVSFSPTSTAVTSTTLALFSCPIVEMGDESFEQHPEALPLVDLSLNSPPPSLLPLPPPLSSSSSVPLACSEWHAPRTHSPLPGGGHH